MKTRARLVGLLATLLIAAILIGLPATLLALGANPLPKSFPTLEHLRAAVTTPDDGTLALGAITVLAWAAWLVLTASILLEAAARLRGVRAPRLPGFSMPQVAARQLVGAAALLFVVAPATATFAPAAHAAPTILTTTAAPPAAPAPAATTHTSTASPAGPAAPRTYVVRPGDTLSRIARRELGHAGRWRDLVDLNPAVAANPDRIHAGTVLLLPPPPAPAEHTYTVRAGDTLSGIARRELGDPGRYPEIFTASKDTPQPGGGHLSDPDTIDVGQTLTVPATGTPAAASPADAGPAPTATATAPLRPDPDRMAAAPSPASTPASAAATPTTIPSSIAGGSTSSSAEPGEQAPHAAWMLAGLTGAGALLAGSLWVLLRRRRHAQFRHRRPGRTLAAPPLVLGPVEKTITAVGAVTAPTVEHMDVILRRLAAAAARDGTAMPKLTAVELTDTHLALHLAAPASLPPPWTGSDDQLHWRIDPATPPEQVGPHVLDQPAPYPLLVTIGLGEHDEVWLLNIEDRHVTITGDPTYGQDFARYLAAEVACNPWSAGVQVACLGVAGELAALNPDRIRVYDPHAADPVEDLVADAVQTIDRAADIGADIGADVATARARRAGADAWPARLLLADAATSTDTLERLLDLVHSHPGQTATSVVVAGHRPGTPGTLLQVSADGRLTMPQAGLDLVAVGLTSDEAEGCAALLAHADTAADAAVPAEPDPTEGWRAYTDTAGALRQEHTQPRQAPDPDNEDAEPTSSLLAEQDETYLEAAATTTADLQALAPRVDERVRQHVEDADPALDEDVAMWFRDDADLPKLHLLGPVRASTRGKPLTKRKPYMTELLTYIALRPNGATPEEVAETFTISDDKARDYAMTLRHWLGTNPRTGQPHLPDARKSPAAGVRGVPVYQAVDLLIDIDLFRRLRARGQARGGQTGIADLRTALRLVDGRPFDYPIQREDGGGWAWLLEGDRLDQHMAVAVVDVAHIVTTDALAHGDLATARLAAVTAALAAPYEEIPRLDLAAVATAEGHHAEAQHIIRDQICNRTDDDGPPPELPDRTEQILKQRKRWGDTKAS